MKAETSRETDPYYVPPELRDATLRITHNYEYYKEVSKEDLRTIEELLFARTADPGETLTRSNEFYSSVEKIATIRAERERTIQTAKKITEAIEKGITDAIEDKSRHIFLHSNAIEGDMYYILVHNGRTCNCRSNARTVSKYKKKSIFFIAKRLLEANILETKKGN